MSDEIWQNIANFENLYQISNYGNVKSLNYRKTGKEQILKPTTNNDGYKLVLLYKNGSRKTLSIHRLVANAFIPNPNNLPEINHIDRDKTNNTVENLEWCTHKENTDYRDLTNKPVGHSILTKEEVKTIRKMKKIGEKCRKVWEQHFNNMSLSGFEKVWYGCTWKEIKEKNDSLQ